MKQMILKGFLVIAMVCFSTVAMAQDSASEKALLAAIQANPNDPTAHFNLGISYFNEQKYDLATPEFQKCVQINSSDTKAKEMYESSAGISAYFLHNYPVAVDHLKNALNINPENPNANLLISDAYVQMKDYTNAEAALKKYETVSPEGKEKVSEILSKIYMDQKRYEEAAVELKNVVEANPKNFEANENLGVAYFQMKDYKDSAHYWENTVSIQKDAQTYKFLGFSYYNLGDFTDAISNYKKSIELESSKAAADQNTESLGETYFNLAVAYNDNALYDDAADAFQQAFKINPKDSNAAVGQAQAIEAATNAHMEKASSYLLNNQYSDAIDEWQQVLKYQPDNQQAKGFIADAQAKMNPEVDKHFAAGKKYAKNGDSLEALNEWNLALQIDPNNDDVKEAIKGLKAIKKDRVKALVAQAEDYVEAKDFSDAILSFKKAREIDPDNSKVKKRLKQLLGKQSDASDSIYAKAEKNYGNGDLKEALKDLQEAKQIDPSNSKIAGFLFKVQKDITVKVKELDSDGTDLFNSGNKDKAMEKFQEVLKLKSNDDTANDYVKQMTGQQSQAKVDSEKAKSLYYEGVDLYINGKISEAIGKWQACLEADPGNVNAQANIDKAKAKLQSIEKLNQS
jgi:tetratricopeptide (TPR) repeat protein